MLDKVSHALAQAGAAVGHAFEKFGQFIGDAFKHAWLSFKHFWHGYGQCIGESARLGREGGDRYMGAAHRAADEFWIAIGPALGELTLEEREKAVKDNWLKVRGRLVNEAGTSRNKVCNWARDYFTKGKSKQDGFNTCSRNYDDHLRVLAHDLDASYDLHIHAGLTHSGQSHYGASIMPPGGATSKHVAPPPQAGKMSADHDHNVEQLEAKYKRQLEECKAKRDGHAHYGAGGKIIPTDKACEATFNAQMHSIGKGTAPAANETDDEKRHRLYEQLQACLRNPIIRFHNLGDAHEKCEKNYRDALKKEGITEHPEEKEPPPGTPHTER
jgi:hypothetical protein